MSAGDKCFQRGQNTYVLHHISNELIAQLAVQDRNFYIRHGMDPDVIPFTVLEILKDGQVEKYSYMIIPTVVANDCWNNSTSKVSKLTSSE
jgi:hypothetical protein